MAAVRGVMDGDFEMVGTSVASILMSSAGDQEAAGALLSCPTALAASSSLAAGPDRAARRSRRRALRPPRLREPGGNLRDHRPPRHAGHGAAGPHHEAEGVPVGVLRREGHAGLRQLGAWLSSFERAGCQGGCAGAPLLPLVCRRADSPPDPPKPRQVSIATESDRIAQRQRRKEERKAERRAAAGSDPLLEWLNSAGIGFELVLENDRSAWAEREDGDTSFRDLGFAVGGGGGSWAKGVLPAGTTRKRFQGYEDVTVPAPPPAPRPEGEELVPITELAEWAQPAFEGRATRVPRTAYARRAAAPAALPGSVSELLVAAFGNRRYKHLNRIQSRIFPAAYHSNENLLVCAPTGARSQRAAGREHPRLHPLVLRWTDESLTFSHQTPNQTGAGKTNIAMLTVLHELAQHVGQRNPKKPDEFKIVYVAPMKALAAEVAAAFCARPGIPIRGGRASDACSAVTRLDPV